MTFDLLLRDVEVEGRRVDVGVTGGRVAVLADGPTPGAAAVLDGRGGALLPGLHDHHVHLLAMAAAATSVDLSPTSDGAAAVAAVRAAARDLPPGAWLRVVGYHAALAGDLDRRELDRWVPDRPVRVQDRSGARWTLNGAGVAAADLALAEHPGVERDPSGAPTGRVHRADGWLRERLPASPGPDLAALGRRLAAWGITGATDTTPFEDPSGPQALADAVGSGALRQRVTVTGGPALTGLRPPAGLDRGPVKLVVDDGAYPALDELAGQVAAAHAAGRAVAVHTVTRTSLVLALAAFEAAARGAATPRRNRSGPDRLEHGAVVPDELLPLVRDLGLTVVTQPGFVRERGDRYLVEVDPDDLPHLYRCRSLLKAGIPVAASSDGPYTDGDPWAAMATAVDRRTRDGATVGPDEAVAPAVALGLYLGRPDDPGGPPRRVVDGAPADLVLLDRPLAALLDRPSAEAVVATVIDGEVVHRR